MGLSQVSRADILPVFGEDIGKNIFFIHLSERRKQLEQIPWIEKATVMRILPDQIRVSIVERKPIAFVREGQQIALVDGDGVVLTMSPEAMTQHHYSFPVVTGIDPRDAPVSRKTRMAVYRRLIDELDANGQHLSRQISEIDLTDPEDARVLMEDDATLLHFGDEQFLARYQRYKAHIAEWRQQYPQLSAIDLRYDNQVVLKMAPGASAATTAVSTADGQPVANAAAESAGITSGKPSPATPPEAAAKPIRPEHKTAPEHNTKAQHKTQAHHAVKPKAKSAAEREKERREAARKAALLRRQRTSSINASRQGQ
jgi:cell division protein FtsQ